MFSKVVRSDGSPRPPYVEVKGVDGLKIVRDGHGRMLKGFRMLPGGGYAVAGWKPREGEG